MSIGSISRPSRRLEKYVRAGGGLGFFVGELTRARFVNEQLYRDGQGLFPASAGRRDATPGRSPGKRGRSGSGRPSDLQGLRRRAQQLHRRRHHRAVFLGRQGLGAQARFGHKRHRPAAQRRSAGRRAQVRRGPRRGRAYHRRADSGTTGRRIPRSSSRSSSCSRIWPRARPRTRASSARPSNWRSTRHATSARVRCSAPGLGENGSLSSEAVQGPKGLTAVFSDTSSSGVYEAQLTTTDNANEVRPICGQRRSRRRRSDRVDRDRLAARLEGVRYDYRRAGDFQFAPHELAGSNLSDWLLYLLVFGLIGEQLLAYSASYHPPAKEGAR